jgi:PAS domain S-box-containing protein
MTFVLTLDGQFIFASPQAKPVTGYDADDLLLMSCKDLIAPKDIQQFQRKVASAAGGRKVAPFEVATERPSLRSSKIRQRSDSNLLEVVFIIFSMARR